MTTLTRRFFLASLGAAPAAWSSSWEQAQFPNWNSRMIHQILTDSPWAKPLTVAFRLPTLPDREVESQFAQIGSPGGIGLPRIPGVSWPGSSGPRSSPGSSRTGGNTGAGAKTEIYLTTRWASALPVRQALALHEFGPDGLKSPRAIELVEQPLTEHVIEIAGFPTTLVRQGARRFEAELIKTSRLFVAGRRPVAPTSVSVPEHGMHLVATLRFPLLEDLSTKDAVDVYAESGALKIEQRFKLKPMLYNGRLEL